MYEPILVKENLLYLLVLAIAAIITFLFTPVTRIIAKKTGAVDIPDKERKFHRTPTPRLGGIAIAFGFAVAAICSELIFKGTVSKEMMITVVGGLIVCAFGIVDDIFNLPALLKFFVQICIAVATVLMGGAIEYTTIFGHTIIFGAWSIPVTILWIVLLINAMNLIDGLDGLACGVSFLSSVALLIIAILMGEPVCAMIAAALCGASVGFLPYNVNPAAVFMGDSGSTMYGYVLACISIFGFFKGATLISSIAPALVFALPVIDVIVTFGQRVIGGKNPFKPDRSHLHYKLVDIGFSPKQAVAIIYIASAIFCGAAIFSLYNKMASLIIAGCLFLFLFLLKHVDKLLPGEVKKKKAAVTDEASGENTAIEESKNVNVGGDASTTDRTEPTSANKADNTGKNAHERKSESEDVALSNEKTANSTDKQSGGERAEKESGISHTDNKNSSGDRGENKSDTSRKNNKKNNKKNKKNRSGEKIAFAAATAAASSSKNGGRDDRKEEKTEKSEKKFEEKSSENNVKTGEVITGKENHESNKNGSEKHEENKAESKKEQRRTNDRSGEKIAFAAATAAASSSKNDVRDDRKEENTEKSEKESGKKSGESVNKAPAVEETTEAPVAEETAETETTEAPVAEETAETETTEAPVAEETAETETTEAPTAEETAETETTETPAAEETAETEATEAPATEETAEIETTEAPAAEETTETEATETPVAEETGEEDSVAASAEAEEKKDDKSV